MFIDLVKAFDKLARKKIALKLLFAKLGPQIISRREPSLTDCSQFAYANICFLRYQVYHRYG